MFDGRRAHLFPGDEIIVCFGNRYAPDQYEAQIGTDLLPCDLVAAGGLAAIELSRHQRMKPPTRITPLGILGDAEGNRLNVMQFGVQAPEFAPTIPAILSLGTSMNAGKTLTATSLVRGFKRMGYKVAALKITGTGAGGDMWIVRDAGADISLDFTDAGHASTYLVSIPEIEAATNRLMNHAAAQGCEVAVIEIADGLQQLETAQLIRSPSIMDFTIGTVFAAYDAMGAKYGFDILTEAGHDVLALSGRLGRSPLGVREAEAATGLRVFSPWELQDGALMGAIRDRAAKASAIKGDRWPTLKALAQSVVPDSILLGNMVPVGMSATESRRIGLSGTSLARDILACAAHHQMDIDADRICGVGYGQRDKKRRDWRNGVRPRQWVTDFGVIELRVPRLKNAGYEPPFLGMASAPAGAVKAVIDACPAEFETAIARLLSSLAPGRRGQEDLSDLALNIRDLLNAARLHGVPAHDAAPAPSWSRTPWSGDEALADEDEALDDALEFEFGLNGAVADPAGRRIAAAE
ncbi:transposase [Paracoccus halophilus]|uniref:transposase n=1 Tax=Paracoccus halophilus TaxID=376733 RepID=UPI000691682A|nr:transposase [Paracoccus halophilus]